MKKVRKGLSEQRAKKTLLTGHIAYDTVKIHEDTFSEPNK